MNAPLIGLIGKKRVGKDTFAATLTERHGYTRVALADPLRDAARELDPIMGTFPLLDEGLTRVREWRYSDVIDSIGYEKAKDYAPEIRRTLQKLGQAIRTIDPEFWLRAAMAKVDAIDGPVVITDVRFPNEADAIKAAGGYLVRITRDLPDDGDTDISETALDDYREDLWIGNNGSREDLAYLAFAVGRDLEFMQAVRRA